ncbi:MAG: DoxX family protein [Acidobacteria bacterium]|nr:DoxX family protein [Acidobacteriota bacterium]MBV9623846.1 DoxX family protein [Acidobacteriota bacterium]
MSLNVERINRSRSRLGNTLVYFSGILLIGSSIAKFAHLPKVASQLAAIGFSGNRLTIIAALEIVSAVLFLVRPLRAAGLLMASAYMGGAIAAHMGHGEAVVQPAFVLALLWVGTWLRHPGILWSLPETAAQTRGASPSHVRNTLQRRAWQAS